MQQRWARQSGFVGLLAMLVMAALAGPASAQLSSSGGPISYSAASLEYADNDRRVVLRGDVDIVQGDSRLRADEVTFILASSPSTPATGGGASIGTNDIERMIARGKVFYVRPQQVARGNAAEYVTADDTVTFTGNVIVESAENIIRGEVLTLQISTRRTTITPNRETGGRVRGVLRPDSRPQQTPAQPRR